MNEPHIFILSEQALTKVVDQIPDDKWDMMMPDDFYTMGNEKMNLRTVINYHAYDDAWVPDMLAGKTMEEVGVDTFKGDLLGDTPKENFANIAEKACAAAKELDDLDRIVHCSFGDYKAREYLWQIITFRGFRAYELAKIIGVDPNLEPELVQGMWDILLPHVEEWRAMGIFQAKVEVPEDADLQTKLLGLSGRRP